MEPTEKLRTWTKEQLAATEGKGDGWHGFFLEMKSWLDNHLGPEEERP